jgi:hypothetical protein
VLPFFGVGDFARQDSRRALKVESVLQDYNGGNLIYDRARLLRRSAGCPERCLRGNGGQPLVDESNGEVRCGSEARCESRRIVGGRRPRTGQGEGKPDDELDRVELCGDRNDPLDVAGSALNRLHRGGEEGVEVAARDPNPNRSDVDADADSCAHR